jgi:NADH-ubiquinone oxidoreductase chain 1
VPLLPIFIVFLIGSIAETNRAPFDLAEAESELVSGFMTEHAAVIFVFFFLAEYASIVLICTLTSILFLGGYLFDYLYFIYPYFAQFINYLDSEIFIFSGNFLSDPVYNPYLSLSLNENVSFDNPIVEGLFYSCSLGAKSFFMIFVFI